MRYVIIVSLSIAGFISAQENKKEPAYQEKTLSQWLELLKSSGHAVNEEAIDALTQIGPAAIPALTKTLKHKNYSARSGAVRAIGNMGPAAKDAVPELVIALKDKHPSVQRIATLALGAIGPQAEDAVPSLAAKNSHNFMEITELRQKIEAMGGDFQKGERLFRNHCRQPKSSHFPPPGFPKGMYFYATPNMIVKLSELQIDRPFGLFLQRGNETHVKALAKQKHLVALTLYGSLVTEANLVHVGKMKQLRVLQLCCSDKARTGIKHLPSLDKLQTICLYYCSARINPAGFKKLELIVSRKDGHTRVWKKTAKTSK